MIASAIVFFIAAILYFILLSISSKFTFLTSWLPFFRWIVIGLALLFALFAIIKLIKTIFGKD